MKTVKLSVAGMSCSHCVATVESALVVVQGVTDVDISLPENRATVHVEDGVEVTTLVEAVERAGYAAALAGRS